MVGHSICKGFERVVPWLGEDGCPAVWDFFKGFFETQISRYNGCSPAVKSVFVKALLRQLALVKRRSNTVKLQVVDLDYWSNHCISLCSLFIDFALF